MTTTFGVVGAGQMGSYHARVIASDLRANLDFVIDPREQEGQILADKYGAKWFPSIPNELEADGVVVAAATEAHPQIALKLLDLGIPILLEKPIAANIDEVELIVKTASARNVFLMCGLLERFNPAVLTAKALISRPLHSSSTRHSPYAPRIKTGVGWDLLIHDVDLAIEFFGQAPDSIQGSSTVLHPLSLPTAEDVSEGILAFPGGGLAHVSASRMGQKKIRQFSIYEEDRLIEIDLLRRDVTIFHNVSEQSLSEGKGYKQESIIEIPEIVSSAEPLTAQFDQFQKSIELIESGQSVDVPDYLPAHHAVAQILSKGLDSH